MRPLVVSILGLAFLFSAQRCEAGEFSCNSIDGEFTRCALRDAHKMKVKLKLDREGGCKRGDTWGVDADGVWVDMGCRAVFAYKDPATRTWWRRFVPKFGQ
ncbi:DUF3011 domain-containing protein [Methylocystis echinoides]|uniref:DUF3011 domain-containing protein n=1 Tax=Methylocystis echinoides TaxID=29468 RepID=UPI003419E53B